MIDTHLQYKRFLIRTPGGLPWDFGAHRSSRVSEPGLCTRAKCCRVSKYRVVPISNFTWVGGLGYIPDTRLFSSGVGSGVGWLLGVRCDALILIPTLISLRFSTREETIFSIVSCRTV